MPARTPKHLTKKQRRTLREIDDPLPTRKEAFRMVNQLIDERAPMYLPHAVEMLQELNDSAGVSRKVVLCFQCAKKIGVRHCSGCPDTPETRYCSKECQLAAWPAHKPFCRGRGVVDVD